MAKKHMFDFHTSKEKFERLSYSQDVVIQEIINEYLFEIFEFKYGKTLTTMEAIEIPYKKVTEFFVYYKAHKGCCNLHKSKFNRWYIVLDYYSVERPMIFEIYGESWTKTQLLDKIREISRLNIVYEKEDTDNLIELFKHHPRAHEFDFNNIDCIFSCLNDYETGYEFRIKYNSGIITNISYHRTINNIYNNLHLYKKCKSDDIKPVDNRDDLSDFVKGLLPREGLEDD